MTPGAILRLSCFAIFLFGGQSNHAQSQTNQGSQKMDQSQIQSTIDKNNSAVAAGDIDGILTTYEPNAALMGQPGMPVMGIPAIREAFKQFLVLEPKITLSNQEVIQANDIAIHSSTWKMSGKTPDGNPVEHGGLSVVVLRKQSDGRWLMVIDNPFGDHPLNKK